MGRRGKKPAFFFMRLQAFPRPGVLCQPADFLPLSRVAKERWSLKPPCSFSVTRCVRERRTADHCDEINKKKYGLTLNKLNLNTVFGKLSDLLHVSVGDPSKLV